jgi:transcriptional regulator with XRE-family HTH domain
MEHGPGTMSETVKRDLGRRLKEFRGRRGASLSEMAEETGISRSFLHMVESGESDISVGRLVAISNYFGTSVAELLDPHQGKLDIEVFGHDDGKQFTSTEEGVDIRFLGRSRWKLSPTMVDYKVGSEVTFSLDDPPLLGQDLHREMFLHVISGAFALVPPSDPQVRLAKGESALVRGKLTRIENVGRGRSRMLMVGIESD